MPHAIAFDTLDSVKRLVGVGFSEQQAEMQTRIIAEVVDEQLATKQDLSALATRESFAQLERRMDLLATKEDIVRLDRRIDEGINRLNRRMDEDIIRLDRRMDEDIIRLDRRMDADTSRLDRRIDAIDGELKLIKWMLALVFAVTVLPALKTLFGLLP